MNANRISSRVAILRLLFLGMPLLLNDLYLGLLPEDNTRLEIVLDVLFYIAWQSSVIYFAWQAGLFRFSEFGFSPVRVVNQLRDGFLLFLAATFVFMLLYFAMSSVDSRMGTHWASEWHDPLPDWASWKQFAWVLYLSVTAGVFEEVIYRGIVMGQLRRAGMNNVAVLLLSATFFALIHWSLGIFTLIVAFTFGLIWGILYMRYAALLPVIIAHFLFDFVVFYNWDLAILRMLGGQ